MSRPFGGEASTDGAVQPGLDVIGRVHAREVNRTDRLYALVEELRAMAPRPRTARQLAERFELSVRTIERDLGALLEAGVPIYATPGPGGGYAVDRSHTLPPVNFTPDEATAMAIALGRAGATPFSDRLRSALRKVVSAMSEADADTATAMTERVRLLSPAPPMRRRAVRVIEDAVLMHHVVELDYQDRNGVTTTRRVEPVALVGSDTAWYLVGVCRLRREGRAFRLDRVIDARSTGERAPTRDVDAFTADIPETVTRLSLVD